jgi:hypothetical protein
MDMNMLKLETIKHQIIEIYQTYVSKVKSESNEAVDAIAKRVNDGQVALVMKQFNKKDLANLAIKRLRVSGELSIEQRDIFVGFDDDSDEDRRAVITTTNAKIKHSEGVCNAMLDTLIMNDFESLQPCLISLENELNEITGDEKGSTHRAGHHIDFNIY